MKSKFLQFAVLTIFLFSACKKSSPDDNASDEYGTKLNTWTFTQGSTTYNGVMVFETSSLNTFLQSNNAYTFGILGAEINTGHIFNVVLSLADLDFSTKSYQSGVDGSDLLNAFYYTETPGSVDDIYKSSNLDPGPIMSYTITDYDAAKDIVTITFSGKANDVDGNEVTITKGKITTKIERL